MRRLLTHALDSVSRLIPLRLYPRLVRREVTSIFYHAVSDEAMPHMRHLYPVVPVAAFESALDFLQGNYTFITYPQLHDHKLNGTPLPPRAVHLSFDDGFAECFTVVRPLLQARGLTCTFFLTIDWLDNRRLYFRHLISLCVDRALRLEVPARREFLRGLNQRFRLSLPDEAAFIDWILAFRDPDEAVLDSICTDLKIDVDEFLARQQPYLTSSQIQQMHQEGFTIGAHGLSHRKLGFIPANEIEVEIVGSCQAIQGVTGQEVVPFSFPQSAGNISRVQLADIRLHNPQVGYLFDTKDLRKDADFMVNRVWAERPLTPSRELHPLNEILAHAYQDAWVDGVVHRLRRH